MPDSEYNVSRLIGFSVSRYIETAKENHLDPYAYLLHIFRTAPNLDRTSTDWVLPLLPKNAPDECKVNF